MSKKIKKIQKDILTKTTTVISQNNSSQFELANFSPMDKSFKWGVFILLFFTGILFYFGSFKNGFIWDDEMVITPNLFIRDWAHLKEILSTDIHHFGLDKSNFYRPLQAVSYMLDYTFWQLNPMGFHISSVLIHIVNSFLVYLLIFRILCSIEPKLISRSRQVAVACSCVWLVHPIHTQVVAYAAGRADQLVAMFMLSSIYTFMICQKSWISAGFFMLALLSKEYGMITPAFILLINSFKLSKNNSSLLFKFAPYAVILVVYIFLRLTLLNFPTDFNTESIPGMYQRLLTSSIAMVILLKLLFVPFDLSMDRNIEWQTSAIDPNVVFSILIILIISVLAYRYKKKFPVALLGFVWFCIAYLPIANIIPMNANVSEHWMYIPSIGIWLIFFYLLHLILNKYDKKVFYGTVIILTVYFGIILINRNKDFKDEITFYNQILKREYKNARVHYNLGCAYFYAGKEKESYHHLTEAIKLKPDYAAAYGNLGQLEYRKGNVEKAIGLYEKANELKDNLVENRVNLGMAYIAKKRFEEGIGQLTIALQINPRHVAALNNMGIALASQEHFESAEKFFKQALTIDPTDVSAKKNLIHLSVLMKQPSK